MSRQKIITIFALTVLLVLPLTYNSCGPTPEGTKTGNPLNLPINTTAMFRMSAYTGVSTITFCFKRLRFKNGSGSINTDFALGEKVLSPSGTDLKEVKVPEGSFDLIEFELDDGCPSGKSVQVTNNHGSFSADDGMSIRFEGLVNSQDVEKALMFQLQKIADRLATVHAGSEIKDALDIDCDFD